MADESYTLEAGEKATQVMIGTAEALIWGDLITKEQVQMAAYLNTLAEDFVPLHAVKLLFLTKQQQTPPIQRPVAYVKQEEILFFFAMGAGEAVPGETEVRRHEPVEVVVGSFQIEGTILKSPIATMLNLLLVSRDAYTHFYRATIRHVFSPWLGTFATDVVQVRRDRMIMLTS